MSQTLQSVLCITTNKYLVHVLVVLLHARFSVVGPIPFLLAANFFSVHPYIGSTTVLPDRVMVLNVKAGPNPSDVRLGRVLSQWPPQDPRKFSTVGQHSF